MDIIISNPERRINLLISQGLHPRTLIPADGPNSLSIFFHTLKFRGFLPSLNLILDALFIHCLQDKDVVHGIYGLDSKELNLIDLLIDFSESAKNESDIIFFYLSQLKAIESKNQALNTLGEIKASKSSTGI